MERIDDAIFRKVLLAVLLMSGLVLTVLHVSDLAEKLVSQVHALCFHCCNGDWLPEKSQESEYRL